MTSRINDSKHISAFSTTGCTSTGDHRTFPLMSLNSFAPAFLPQYQSPSDPPISPCNSIMMSLPLAQIFCGMPSLITPSHAPPLRQLITDDTFILLLSSQKIHLSRMQQLINHLLDLYLFCLHLSIIKRTVYRLFTRPSNRSTNI